MVDGSSAKSPSGGVHVAPSMAATLVNEDIPERAGVLGSGILRICVLSAFLGFVGFVAAMILIKAIGLLTNLCFYGRWSFAFVPPTDAHLGYWIILIPVAGAVAVGLLARYGHAGIRGHGIPEAMESILTKDSRVPRSIVFLKPLSAVLSIGTGGPFGAEGPIIATGGAFGSMIGQMLHTTAEERKILLSAGAAAGMSATFGSPIAAILLAVELLLFEFSPRSLIPVALASGIAAGLRILVLGASPIFHMQPFGAPTHFSLLFYAIIGAQALSCKPKAGTGAGRVLKKQIHDHLAAQSGHFFYTSGGHFLQCPCGIQQSCNIVRRKFLKGQQMRTIPMVSGFGQSCPPFPFLSGSMKTPS